MIYSYQRTIAEFDLETINLEIETFCEQNEVPANKLFSIQLIIEELVTNIIKYGKSQKNDEIITVELKVEMEEIDLTITDNSAAFNPLEEEEADTGLSAEERSIGGLGLFLVRKRVKALNYENKSGFNILRAKI
ncbi:MAG TPA: ATP-binding protein [Bacillota bacterium]|nr:ATP-binding protein [Bacillota bacterium]